MATLAEAAHQISTGGKMSNVRWIVAVALLGCATGQPPSQGSASVATTGRRTIELRVPVGTTDAEEQVVRGVARAGRAVTNRQPGLLRIGPYQYDAATSVTLVASVASESEFATRIVLNGSYRVPSEGIDEAITQDTTGRRALMWQEMRRIADAISSTR